MAKNSNRTNEGWIGWKIKKEIVALRPKIYSYLTDFDHVGKEAKSTKKCVIKREIKSKVSKST